jgi:hypothetical protein
MLTWLSTAHGFRRGGCHHSGGRGGLVAARPAAAVLSSKILALHARIDALEAFNRDARLLVLDQTLVEHRPRHGRPGGAGARVLHVLCLSNKLQRQLHTEPVYPFGLST